MRIGNQPHTLNVNTQPQADEVTDDEREGGHTQAKPSHFKEARPKGFVFGD